MNMKVISGILFILALFGAIPSALAISNATYGDVIIQPHAYKYITVTEKYFGVYPEEINYADGEGYQGILRFTSAIDAGGGWWLVTYGGYVRQN
ncbi:hypothetical protein [Brevibacillus sp. SAFN-007a]|uniref:hypothetical protein n=1 Tax=Brevibacillus sp. SAFN-007a TaxID=3436862 RepID=UPI003F807DEF